jgi:hypothetical protein
VPALVVVAEQLQDLRLLEVEAERAHGDLELVIVDGAVLVRIKELERLLDLLLLLVRQLRPRVRAPLGRLLRSGRAVHIGLVEKRVKGSGLDACGTGAHQRLAATEEEEEHGPE